MGNVGGQQLYEILLQVVTGDAFKMPGVIAKVFCLSPCEWITYDGR